MRIFFSEDMTTFMVSHSNRDTFTFIQKYAILFKMTESHEIEPWSEIQLDLRIVIQNRYFWMQMF